MGKLRLKANAHEPGYTKSQAARSSRNPSTHTPGLYPRSQLRCGVSRLGDSLSPLPSVAAKLSTHLLFPDCRRGAMEGVGGGCTLTKMLPPMQGIRSTGMSRTKRAGRRSQAWSFHGICCDPRLLSIW